MTTRRRWRSRCSEEEKERAWNLLAGSSLRLHSGGPRTPADCLSPPGEEPARRPGRGDATPAPDARWRSGCLGQGSATLIYEPGPQGERRGPGHLSSSSLMAWGRAPTPPYLAEHPLLPSLFQTTCLYGHEQGLLFIFLSKTFCKDSNPGNRFSEIKVRGGD